MTEGSAILRRSWSRAWRDVGGNGDGLDLMERLQACYLEPHRRYHTLRHLIECVEKLEPVLDLAERSGELEIALWFHDAVYRVERHDNEVQSAIWARQELLAGGVASPCAERVHALVMATRHDRQPATIDEALVADVDLHILAAPAARFDEYERQVRKEYVQIPASTYRRERAAILAGFLDRARIFQSGHFHDTLEVAARDNLRRSILRLGS